MAKELRDYTTKELENELHNRRYRKDIDDAISTGKINGYEVETGMFGGKTITIEINGGA